MLLVATNLQETNQFQCLGTELKSLKSSKARMPFFQNLRTKLQILKNQWPNYNYENFWTRGLMTSRTVPLYQEPLKNASNQW